MHFIEKIFGISPDGGSGSLEFLLFAIPALGLYLLCSRRSRAKTKTRKTAQQVETRD